MTATDFEKQLAQIRDAGKKRDYPKAIELCSELLSQTDQYPEAILYLGRSYHALGQYDKAVHAYEFFLTRKPDSLIGHFFLGRAFSALGLHKNAILSLKLALAKDPGFAPALSFIGLSYLKLRRPETAIPYFEKALKVDPNNQRIRTAYLNALLVQGVRLFYRKDLEGSARVFEFLIKEQRENIVPYIYLAVIAREFGNYTLSLVYYDEALRISHSDPVFHLHKAHLYFKMGKNEDALSELKQAKKILKDDLPGMSDPEQLLKLIAVTHYRNKRFREAIYFGKQVLKNNYKDTDMHMLLAECYRFFGDLTKAKNHYTRALETSPGREEIYYGLMVVLWEMEDFPELLKLARRLERLKPGDAMAAYFQTLCMAELKVPSEKLIPLLREAIHKQGPDPHLMFSLGREYVRSGRNDLAESWLLRTLTLLSGHRESLLLLDQVYESLKRYTDEIRVLEQYCGRFPADIALRKKYVRLLLVESRYPEAAGVLEQLITLDPSNSALRKSLGLVYLKNKKYNDALIMFKELILREPKSVLYLRMLIFCLVHLRKQKAAILILEKASKYIKNEPGLLLPLGVLYGRQKNYEKASEIFRRVVSGKTKDWRAYRNLAMVYRRTGNKALAETFLQRAEEYKAIGAQAGKNSRIKKGKTK